MNTMYWNPNLNSLYIVYKSGAVERMYLSGLFLPSDWEFAPLLTGRDVKKMAQKGRAVFVSKWK